ncbi:hypothetical protein J4423_01315 [Candidatus Pacearchaeota archaeon]|nr:hypothetical protein [Candidatus Pacearchaeota archaeon]
MKLDSDGGGRFSGRVNSLVRGVPGGFSSDNNNLVTLSLDSRGTVQLVDLPIRTQSDFDLIPYQLGLTGQYVDYFKDLGFVGGVKWRLEVTSGPLRGNVYSYPSD